MYVGPDGQLHYKYDANVNNPHWNRMNMARSLDGRTSPNQYQRQASPDGRTNVVAVVVVIVDLGWLQQWQLH